MEEVTTDNGFWLKVDGDDVIVRCSDDHYDETYRRYYPLADGESIAVQTQHVVWGRGGGVSLGKRRLVTNTPALRQWLRDLGGGIWSWSREFSDAPDIVVLPAARH